MNVPGKDRIEATLVDYFVIAGYDSDIGLMAENVYDTGNLNDSNFIPADRFRPPLQRSYKAKILHHFPQKRPTAPFSTDILSLCMPKGLRFFTEKDVPSTSMHTFANIKEDGSRVNGTVITFYEEVRDALLCEAMSRLQMEHVREITNERTNSTRDRTHVPPGTVSGGTHTLPRKPGRDKAKRISYYDGGGQNLLFMSKTLCLLTRIPLVSATKSILKALHNVIKSSSPQPPPLPLESYIYWILNEIPLPSPGTTLKLSLNDTTVLVQRPGSSELPFFDDSMGTMFQFLTPEKFLRLFVCFLLEHQILLCSKDYSRLMLVCESLCALAFPFRWQMVYVPILPYSQLKFVEAPVPYVMGWCYEDSVPEFLFQSNVCVLDIDTGRTEFPEDLPSFPGSKQLCQEIKQAIERYSIYDDSGSYISSPTSSGLPPIPPRTNGSTKRSDEWSMKRMSRSFDLDDGIDDEMGMSRLTRAGLQPLPLENVLKNNSTLARVAEIARRAGVVVDVENIEQELTSNDQYANSPDCRRYFQDAKLNNAVRECVVNRIVCMLYSYEHFVVGGQNCTDKEMFEASRDSLVCFDKASFLSDQPDSHLGFLAAFLETQMFTSLIDSKILSQWETPDENLVLFDQRIATLREKLGLSMVQTPTYETSPPFAHTEELISKREGTLDYVVPAPHSLAGCFPIRYDDYWPELNTSLLEGSSGLSPVPSPWKQRYPRLRPKQNELMNGNSSASNRPTSTYGGAGLIGDSPTKIAQQQLKFVDQLLKETKAKTKRMLVDKMGKEAVHLGHFDAGITGVEENTLVATFCDLLERIFTHGLIKKQGKSALWTYVLQHQDLEKTGLSSRTMSSSMLTPGQKKGINGGTLPRAPSLPPCEVPAPVILSPNENDIGEKFTELVDSIQRLAAKADPDAPAWSKNILRAANFLADKISTATTNTSPTAFYQQTPQDMRNDIRGRTGGGGGAVSRSGSREPTKQRFGISGMLRKTSSVSDFTSPGWTGGRNHVDGTASVEGSPRKRSQSRPRSPETKVLLLAPLPTHVAYDLKNVLRMTEIKTDIGYARAFVRLALERKLLHKHLTTLFGNNRLLSEMYKPYAFTRCDDEKEQFLYHILSLNAAQFRCFTNTFTKTKMDYQVVIVAGGGRNTLPSVWIKMEGSLTSGPQINLPPDTPCFKFDHRNLGALSTLRIGHANTSTSDRPPKWFLDYVIVRNEITGQTYRFPCGRWFGKGVDDGSLERLLVAEPVVEEEGEHLSTCPSSPARGRRRAPSRSQTPQRERSPSTGRQDHNVVNRNSKSRVIEIQHLLGEAVNSLVKYFYGEKRVKSELAHLLCGERGLVNAIEQVFQYGRQESMWTPKMFRQNYPWDYIEKVAVWLCDLVRNERARQALSAAQNDLITYGIKLVRKISNKSELGKDGKFHVFVLLTIRDHVLSGLLQLMAWTPVTQQMYDEHSFLRKPENVTHLSRLLDSLDEYRFTLEPSLTYNIV